MDSRFMVWCTAEQAPSSADNVTRKCYSCGSTEHDAFVEADPWYDGVVDLGDGTL